MRCYSTGRFWFDPAVNHCPAGESSLSRLSCLTVFISSVLYSASPRWSLGLSLGHKFSLSRLQMALCDCSVREMFLSGFMVNIAHISLMDKPGNVHSCFISLVTINNLLLELLTVHWTLRGRVFLEISTKQVLQFQGMIMMTSCPDVEKAIAVYFCP